MKRHIKSFWSLILAVTLLAIPAFSSCDEHQDLEMNIVDFRANPTSGYYDVVVKVDYIGYAVKSSAKSSFYINTVPNYRHLELSELTFSKEHGKSQTLDPGDTFIVPVMSPEWQFYVSDQDYHIATLDFYNKLPEAQRFHPLKSEAGKLSQQIQWVEIHGMISPQLPQLPAEWSLIETYTASGTEFNYLQFRKIRVDEVKEKLDVYFRPLTLDELNLLKTKSEVDVMRQIYHGSFIAGSYSHSGTYNGYPALIVDARGMGEFSWTYSTNFIQNGWLLRTDIESDAREWVMTPAEKSQEILNRGILFTYSYGLEPGADWKVDITVRINGEGKMEKHSSSGVTISKAFQLSTSEIKNLGNTFSQSNFIGLSSSNTNPSITYTSLSLIQDDKTYSLNSGKALRPAIKSLQDTIRQIILPKVDEVP